MSLRSIVLLLGLCLVSASALAQERPKTLTDIKRDLSSQDPATRTLAIERLRQSQDPESLALLEKATQDENMMVAVAAYDALASRAQLLPEPYYSEALAVLAGGLIEGNEEVRIAAVGALGDVVRWRKTAPPNVWKTLARATEDPSNRVKIDAIKVISWLGGEEAFPLISARLQDSGADVRAEAVSRLGELGNPKAVSALNAVIFDDSELVRAATAKAFGDLKDPSAVPTLISMLRDLDAKVRAQAAQSLGKLKAKEAVEPLLERLSDPISRVKIFAVVALGEIRDPAAVEPLLSALSFPDTSEVNTKISASLAQIGEAAVEPLVSFWYQARASSDTPQDCTDDVDTRTTAEIVVVLTLKKIKTQSSTDALLQNLSTSSASVRACILSAVADRNDERVAVSLISALQEVDESSKIDLLKALPESLPPSIGVTLASVLRSAKPNVRGLVLSILGKSSVSAEVAAPSFEILLDLVKRSSSPEEVQEAIKILGKIGDPRAEGAFLEALSHSNVKIRYRAGASIGKLNSPELPKKLLGIAKDPKSPGRVQALRALSFILLKKPDASITDAVAPLIDDPSFEISYLAARILSFAPGTKYSQPLLKYFAASDPRKTALLAGLLVVSDKERAVLPLLQALRSSDNLTRINAAWALGYTQDARAVEPLILALEAGMKNDDNALRASGLIALNAAFSLGLLKDPKAKPVLAACLGVENAELRANCVLAFSRVGGELMPIANLAQRERSSQVRQQAIRALGERISEPQARAVLEQIAAYGQSAQDKEIAQSYLSPKTAPQSSIGFIDPQDQPGNLYKVALPDGMVKATVCDEMGDLIEPLSPKEGSRKTRQYRYENELADPK